MSNRAPGGDNSSGKPGDLSNITILPPVPDLKVQGLLNGQTGRLSVTRDRKKLVFASGGSTASFAVAFKNIVNLEVREKKLVELDVRVMGATMRAVRFKISSPEEDDASIAKWFRGLFFSWVVSKRNQPKLVTSWEPASYMVMTGLKKGATASDAVSLEHDYLLAALVGDDKKRAMFGQMLRQAGREKPQKASRQIEAGAVVAKIAELEFAVMSSLAHRRGWRESYESFDTGVQTVFQSALPAVNQKMMREEFWAWYDMNLIIFQKFREATRAGHTPEALVLSRIAEITRERIGEYAGLAYEAILRSSRRPDDKGR